MKMKLLIFSFLTILSTTALRAQSLDFVGQWQNQNLPISSGVRYNDVWGYTDCRGNEYGILGSLQSIHFIDLRDPANPEEIASFAGGGSSFWRDIKVFRDRAYAVTEDRREGMMIFDLSNLPESISKSNQIKTDFGSAHNIYIDVENARLYAVGTNTRANGVIIYDLSSNPDNPTVIANVSLPGGYVHDVFVRDNIAYCSHGNNGLYIYDFTIADAPVLLGNLTNYPEKGYNHSSWLSPDGNHLVFADETFDTGLKMIDVSNKSDMTVTDVFRSELLAPDRTGSIAHNPFIRDGLIFVSYYHDGVQVFDYSNPSDVKQIAGYDTVENGDYNGFAGSWGTYPYFNSGIVLGSDMENGLFVLKMNGYQFEPINYSALPPIQLSVEATSYSLCNGDELPISVLNNADAEEVDWYRNNEYFTSGKNIVISEKGNYQARLDLGGCLASSKTIVVDKKPSNNTNLSGNQMLCPNKVINFTFDPAEASSYEFYDENDNLLQSGSNPNLEISRAGSYYGIAKLDECTARSETITVEALTPSTTAAIVVDNGTLLASAGISYKWYKDGELLTGENTERIRFLVPGSYEVEIEDAETGCTLRSEALVIQEGEVVDDLDLFYTQLYFAPESKTLFVQFTTPSAALTVNLYDNLGRVIFTETVDSRGLFQKRWNVNELATGIYYLGITDEKTVFYKKVYLQTE